MTINFRSNITLYWANFCFSEHDYFQWITNFVNYIINIQSYQRTNKIHISFKWLLVCLLFHCFGMLQVPENEISLRNSFRGPVCLRTLEGTFPTMQCKSTFTKRFILSTLQRKSLCYGNNHKKTFGGSNSQVH